MIELYPWQSAIKKRLESSQDVHALLLYGHEGIGKNVLARSFATGLLDHWHEAHPDWREVLSEGTKAISIDTIRSLKSFFYESCESGSRKVLLMSDAARMNNQAQNAFLKMLEEPAVNSMIVLVTSAKQRLLPTILSRCIHIKAPFPDIDVATSWLTKQGTKSPEFWMYMASGAPLLAEHYSKTIDADMPMVEWPKLAAKLAAGKTNPVKVAEEMVKHVEIAYLWLAQFAKTLYEYKASADINQPFDVTLLSHLTKRLTEEALWSFYEQTLHYNERYQFETGHNNALALTALWAQWQACFIKRRVQA